MAEKITVVVQGTERVEDVPGLSEVADELELRFATEEEALRESLRGAEVLLGWSFQSGLLRKVWDAAAQLRWVHWSGAGVDALLFPALARSRVTLTNARGIFDRAMAEYTLGLIIAFAKRFAETVRHQAALHWEHRLTERLDGRRAMVVGTGSIGREIAKVLRAFGLEVSGVGRSARRGDPDFGVVHAVSDLDGALADADFVVVIVPLTEQTRGLFGAAQFARMKPSARFINLARGAVVDEPALIDALRGGEIAGAALDVFAEEPLPAESPLWKMDNVFVSPHMSGDYVGHMADIAQIFFTNLRRYRAGEPLLNVIDKRAGFASTGAESR